jgi:hypothetical protein
MGFLEGACVRLARRRNVDGPFLKWIDHVLLLGVVVVFLLE